MREIVLRDKPVEFLNTSPSATVPALVTVDGTVLDESLDIMLWALERNDPESWLAPDTGDVNEMLLLQICQPAHSGGYGGLCDGAS